MKAARYKPHVTFTLQIEHSQNVTSKKKSGLDYQNMGAVTRVETCNFCITSYSHPLSTTHCSLWLSRISCRPVHSLCTSLTTVPFRMLRMYGTTGYAWGEFRNMVPLLRKNAHMKRRLLRSTVSPVTAQ